MASCWAKTKIVLEEYFQERIQKQHDAEVWAKAREEAMDEFARQIIELDNEFPTVEDDFGELRPMTIKEMCNQVAEQLKADRQNE